MVPYLDCFPEELLRHIIRYCQPYSTTALEQTARRFREVTNEPLLWRYYCLSDFKYWAQEHEFPKKVAGPVLSVNWKSLYKSKHLRYRATCRSLDGILATQTRRLDKIQTIIDLGYDAKDALLQNFSVHPEVEDYLARRYYAEALLTSLHRSVAVREWARLKNGEELALDRLLGAFDLFIPKSGLKSLDEISDRLDGISMLMNLAYPAIDRLTTRDKARAVASFLRVNNLTGIEPDKEYHCLEHNFLGIALSDPRHNSLPLVSATIYCYVAQRVGIDARPCGFPFHVHVIVLPPSGCDVDGNILEAGRQGTPMYMDPFRSDLDTPVADLEYQLAFLGTSPTEQANFLGVSQPLEIVLRCSKNILNSLRHLAQISHKELTSVDVIGAKYAAIWSSMLLSYGTRPTEFRHNLQWLIELLNTEFPLDIHLVEQYVIPLIHGLPEYQDILQSLHAMRGMDEIPRRVKRRSSQVSEIKYKVGQVFRHRRYGYRAVITGWDVECGAGEERIRRMDIDYLKGGRHQNFYHVLYVLLGFCFGYVFDADLVSSVEDRSIRYVAEENIEHMEPELSDIPLALVFVAGKYFKRWDELTKTFVSNIQDEYPER
ncbi:YccV-like-domain-containing protein [Aspergillus heteromorphus CBS 117.55]|uniref:YccV-like-domain-containing protein n=1 Tax=Aspergillus heteromorphus CBS 117.55 TaxID=1448321 RepID=A0A317USJ4_9EURO|nr:YccV-like-domain-containing protein [Aspergillus heteromorphus CBS 117.55]PWY65023.1 YccV-like-domain-containing protein [Aspergillus heteromorphus CBS 117.55]